MPKTTKRKMNKRKTRAKKQKTTVSALRGIGPLPSRYITRHKYSTTFTLNALNGYQHFFNLNSLFDPDRTAIGHQPYGFDQLTPLYNRYRVISTSFVVSGIQSDSPGTNIRLACVPMNTITTYPSVSAMCEVPRARFVIQGAQGAPLKTLYGKQYLPALVGRSKAEYMADDRYQSESGASPLEFAVLNVMGQTLLDTNANINAVITMEYVCEWFDLNIVGQS